ncbi:MAG TPA: radical SAM protein [Ilumatobacteraceae bacterium]|jgi:uncharacterized protein|nr:radical SAM protein [Ilumatobacteraceae bacterium]HQY13057.1 radical SAM protein [Ilumatobacteraceae bacterium]HQY85783.1 radical SAM protein [Ilumatobacteraceae bacterium]HRA85426.1 radical SAM protein [Ilumatobacteraceae bacterium]
MKFSRYNTIAVVDDHTFVHNGVGGDFHRLPTTMWERVERFVAGTDSGEGLVDELTMLVRARLVTADDVDELEVLRSRHLRSKYGGGLGLTIVTSLGCNFDCPYCFESKRPSLLKPAVADSLVALLDEAIAAGSPSMNVTWMGGEPLLGAAQLLDLSRVFIDRCDAAGMEYSAGILTNGWHLTTEMAARLASARVGQAQVTIDGPADVHDRYRPKKDGGSSFDRILDNVVSAIDHLQVNIRVNLDSGNLGRVEELMAILAARGLAGKVRLTPARLTAIASADDAPSQSYQGGCYSCSDYGVVELEFDELAARYGFEARGLPRAIGTPCTAVRATELVVGADGELWKCWDDIGNNDEAIGTIFDHKTANAQITKWLGYDPFSDDDCRSCVALPGCMGGCAHHDFFGGRDDRCGTFRFNHQRKVENEALRMSGQPAQATGLVHVEASRLLASIPVSSTPVSIGRTRRRIDPETPALATTLAG